MNMPITNQYIASKDDIEEIFLKHVQHSHYAEIYKFCYWMSMISAFLAMIFADMDRTIGVPIMLLDTLGMLLLLYGWQMHAKKYSSQLDCEQAEFKIVFGDFITAYIGSKELTIDYTDIQNVLHTENFWVLLCNNGWMIPIYKKGLTSKERSLVRKAINKH